jgi:hypothetical protein
MKKTSLFTAFLIMLASFSQAIDVTFRVDMSLQTVPPEGVHLAGSFQGWDPSATLMTTAGGNIYDITLTFTEGEYLEYKFVNGDAWGEEESVPAACAANGNRFLTVPPADTLLAAVCFGSCSPCGNPVQVTFRVDMSEQTVSPEGVHVAGSFQGWNPATTLMTLTGDDIYAVTLTLGDGGYYEYKFINGTTWAQEEQVPPNCGISNGMGGYNRFITVPPTNITLQAVCFGGCNPCGTTPVPVNVTFRVDMSEQVPSPDGIHVAGTFNGWSTDSTQMTSTGNNIYAATLVLNSGDFHQYKFINGIAWSGEELVPSDCGVNNGSGGYNRYVVVPAGDTILPPVCFGECEPCDVGGPESLLKIPVMLEEIYPNPAETMISVPFSLAEPSLVSLTLVGMMGEETRLLEETQKPAGRHEAVCSIGRLAPGIYVCLLEVQAGGKVCLQSTRLIVR